MQLLDLLNELRTSELPNEQFERIDAIRREMDRSTASPYALAISAIAADSSRTLVFRTGAGQTAYAASAAGVVAADVVGGIAGAFIGDELCGPVCAVMGGAAGAAGASLAVQELLQ